MKFGIVLPAERPKAGDPDKIRNELVEQSTMAEELGFESLWIGEHHFMDHIYFNNIETLSYLSGLTNEILLGTSVCLVPLYNPVRLAEYAANLDVLSDGRFVFGCGIGYRKRNSKF